MQLITRLFQAPERSFFLFGPRGTGKSTFMKTHYPDALWIDLLHPNVFRSYSAHPERLYETIAGNPHVSTIVIDEIQKVPSLLAVVHILIEEKHGLQFILSGSSARKLKRTGADLLAGRASKRLMHPFMAAELGANFSLSSALHDGLLPLVIGEKNPQDILHAYILA